MAGIPVHPNTFAELVKQGVIHPDGHYTTAYGGMPRITVAKDEKHVADHCLDMARAFNDAVRPVMERAYREIAETYTARTATGWERLAKKQLDQTLSAAAQAHYTLHKDGTLVSNTATAADIAAALTTARRSPSPQAQMRAALRAKGINAAVLDEKRRAGKGKAKSKAAKRAEAAKIRAGYLAGKQWVESLDADDKRMYATALEAAAHGANLTIESTDPDGGDPRQDMVHPEVILDRLRAGLHWHGGDPADEVNQ